MNSIKLQDIKLTHKNLLYFYTLIMNYQKDKTIKQSHIQANKKNKIPRNKFNRGGKRPVL